MALTQQTLIGNGITDASFACDLVRCKGACCTVPGGRGAPLLDNEIDEIQRAFPIVRKYLSAEHLAVLEAKGLVEGQPGDFVTPCVNNRACAYVTYEQGIAKCSFEKAYHNRELTWRKPLSCHLFPLRLDQRERLRLRYEYLVDCEPALERGKREGIPLVEFLREPLIRAFGDDWYRQLLDDHRSSNHPPTSPASPASRHD
jgi:hypothetical protein